MQYFESCHSESQRLGHSPTSRDSMLDQRLYLYSVWPQSSNLMSCKPVCLQTEGAFRCFYSHLLSYISSLCSRLIVFLALLSIICLSFNPYPIRHELCYQSLVAHLAPCRASAAATGLFHCHHCLTLCSLQAPDSSFILSSRGRFS